MQPLEVLTTPISLNWKSVWKLYLGIKTTFWIRSIGLILAEIRWCLVDEYVCKVAGLCKTQTHFENRQLKPCLVLRCQPPTDFRILKLIMLSGPQLEFTKTRTELSLRTALLSSAARRCGWCAEAGRWVNEVAWFCVRVADVICLLIRLLVAPKDTWVELMLR